MGNTPVSFETSGARRIVCAGIGGSQVPGEIAALQDPRVEVWPRYGLPGDLTDRDFVICTSWSGHTPETLSALQAAIDQHIPAVAITQGNQLANLASKHSIPVITLPPSPGPARFDARAMTETLLTVLGHTVNTQALDATPVTNLAQKIGNRTPVIYTPSSIEAIGWFWKLWLNETAKQAAFVSRLPQTLHNELEMWPSDTFIPLVITDASNTSPEYQDANTLLAFFKEKGYTVYAIGISGETPADKALHSYLEAMATALTLATSRGLDPRRTPVLESFQALRATR